MAMNIRIKKGLDIRLKGEAEEKIVDAPRSGAFAVKPTDFPNLTPLLLAREGTEILAGDPLFCDKYAPHIVINSPVSGIVSKIRRGPKRRIDQVEIQADMTTTYRNFGQVDPTNKAPEVLIERMLAGGVWPFIRQRPYDVIASPNQLPKAIFISAFDSHPLAPNDNFVIEEQMPDFELGMQVLRRLSKGKLHLSVASSQTRSSHFRTVEGVELHELKGPHPVGNVSVQINRIEPLNKGEVVWTLHPQDVAIVGRFFRTGEYRADRIVAVTGSEAVEPCYHRTRLGAPMKNLLGEATLERDDIRVISGNVLTGTQVGKEGFLGFYHSQVTVIPEGDDPHFFLTKGWLAPGFDKFSLSRSFPTWLMGKKKKFRLDTNQNGEERAFVMSGEYEKVFPFDIYPVYLLKAILANDIDAMEKLGIYEVAPEDFALCEYVCTSKVEAQRIVREGLDKLRAEFQ
jgi:Na+-transporting NADH:ubiquinone oxidoreductase subunit A